MTKFAILNSEGRCINITLWDGVGQWAPPSGCTAVPDPDGQYEIWVEPGGLPLPDYVGFYQALIGSALYQAVVTQPATADLAFHMAVFVSEIHNCMAGRENRPAMQGAIWLLVSQIPLDLSHAAELTALMEQYHLAGVYQLQPDPERARDDMGRFLPDDPTTPDVNEAYQS